MNSTASDVPQRSASPADPPTVVWDDRVNGHVKTAMEDMVRYGRATGLQIAVTTLRQAGDHPAFATMSIPDFAKMVSDVFEEKIDPNDLSGGAAEGERCDPPAQPKA